MTPSSYATAFRRRSAAAGSTLNRSKSAYTPTPAVVPAKTLPATQTASETPAQTSAAEVERVPVPAAPKRLSLTDERPGAGVPMLGNEIGWAGR